LRSESAEIGSTQRIREEYGEETKKTWEERRVECGEERRGVGRGKKIREEIKLEERRENRIERKK
jgi:hypothetical protein